MNKLFVGVIFISYVSESVAVAIRIMKLRTFTLLSQTFLLVYLEAIGFFFHKNFKSKFKVVSHYFSVFGFDLSTSNLCSRTLVILLSKY